jgi:hypothetical protein
MANITSTERVSLRRVLRMFITKRLSLSRSGVV